MSAPKYSVIIPAYNEEKNIFPLYKKLKSVMKKMKDDYEMIFINDGSTDGTKKKLEKLSDKDGKIRVLNLSRNFGQTPALAAGFDNARGDIIITMDADLQNDPEDIPRLIEKMDQGYDVVSGWRADRKDSFGKRFFSGMSNRIAGRLTGLRLHDYGCTLKAYRKEAIDSVELYSEFHRYIPALMYQKGYDVTELKVKHHERKRGETKYGSKRLFRGILDLINLSFWNAFSTRPMHFFGGIGIFSFSIGLLISVYLTFLKYFYGISLSNRPLLLLSILLMVLGIQLFMFGFLGAMVVRVYYGDNRRKIYHLKKAEEKK
ncbi:MAG: glycosyltransferase family 2 protein [Thermoplasmata archaeon]